MPSRRVAATATWTTTFRSEHSPVQAGMVAVRIRDERAADAEAVRDVVACAFGRPDEARLVEQLRRDGDAVISLVATSGAAVIGHLLLSPMAAPFRALGLAPLSVAPEHQGRGVGATLIDNAIERGEGRGLVGDLCVGRSGLLWSFWISRRSRCGLFVALCGAKFHAVAAGGYVAGPQRRGRVCAGLRRARLASGCASRGMQRFAFAGLSRSPSRAFFLMSHDPRKYLEKRREKSLQRASEGWFRAWGCAI